ncbi:tetraspanin-8-like [Haliotis rufescens]|uniref:tetraspanin-8-like n=1 Tax=Haliotis rufescens TaxID=6454 RepID=UPI00201E9277|nr:tetraspanin-8-like [Haliotis rufescens]
MRTGLCHTRVKYLLLAFNFLLWLHGMAIVGFGIWILVSIPEEGYTEIKDDEVDEVLKIVGGTLIAGGCAIVIVGIIGCHGTIKENPCRLLGYSISLFIIFAGLLGTGVVIIIKKDKIESKVKETLKTNSSILTVLRKKCPNATEDDVTACTATIMRYPTIVAGLSIGFAQVMILGLVFSLSFHCTK